MLLHYLPAAVGHPRSLLRGALSQQQTLLTAPSLITVSGLPIQEMGWPGLQYGVQIAYIPDGVHTMSGLIHLMQWNAGQRLCSKPCTCSPAWRFICQHRQRRTCASALSTSTPTPSVCSFYEARSDYPAISAIFSLTFRHTSNPLHGAHAAHAASSGCRPNATC